MSCEACRSDQRDANGFCTICGRRQDGMVPKAAHSPPSDGGIPAGVRGWCWGGFLLTWLWAIRHRVWIGLLGLVPYLNIVIAIYLGIKGREMAWKKGSWESVDEFNREQRQWTLCGIAVTVLAFLLGLVIGYLKAAYLHA